MENKKLQMLKSLVNKEIKDHPSPVGLWLNGIIKFVEHAEIHIEYLVREEMCNAGGILQGGMMSAIIDEGMGTCVFTLGGEYHFTSINLNVDFLYPAKPGEKITTKSKVTKDGKSIIYTECQVYNQDERLLSKGASNLMILK